MSDVAGESSVGEPMDRAGETLAGREAAGSATDLRGASQDEDD